MNKGIRKAVQICGGQKALADKCGVQQMSVSYWVRGVMTPSAENMAKIVIATDFKVMPWEIIQSKAIKRVFNQLSKMAQEVE